MALDRGIAVGSRKACIVVTKPGLMLKGKVIGWIQEEVSRFDTIFRRESIAKPLSGLNPFPSPWH